MATAVASAGGSVAVTVVVSEAAATLAIVEIVVSVGVAATVVVEATGARTDTAPHPMPLMDRAVATEVATAVVTTGETSPATATAADGVGMVAVTEVVAHMMTDLEEVVATTTGIATRAALEATWIPSDPGKAVGIKVAGTTTAPETTTRGSAPTTAEATRILGSCDATKEGTTVLSVLPRGGY